MSSVLQIGFLLVSIHFSSAAKARNYGSWSDLVVCLSRNLEVDIEVLASVKQGQGNPKEKPFNVLGRAGGKTLPKIQPGPTATELLQQKNA